MLETSAQNDEPLGYAPDGKPVYLKGGRFGPYVQHGDASDDEKPKNASLLKGMQPEDVTIEVALQLLSLPRTLGQDPQNGQPVMAHNGPLRALREVRQGNPLVAGGPFAARRYAAAGPGAAGAAQVERRGRGAVKREPLKVFEASPVTGNPVQLLAGRYGPYVTDGVTNASLPRGTSPEEVTLEYALNLLKARAEQGPSTKPARRTAKKAAAPKRASAPKKAARKTVKKAAKKSG